MLGMHNNREMRMIIKDKCVVSMDYKLRNTKGEILDKSEGGEPLVYLHGAGFLIPGLEKEITGKTTGDKLRVEIAPEDGYGEYMPQLVQKLPRSAFEGVDDLEVGMEFQASGEKGQIMEVRIDNIEGDEVTINGNHPLAGMTLDFEVEITEVRNATAEELEHGHAHGAEGHH